MTAVTEGDVRDGLVLASHWEAGGEPWLEVIHAEPRALFSGPLLRRVRRGEGFPFTTVDKVGIGGILRINARDRRLVYRIVEHLPYDIYAGEWPD
jgi:hypothetical protein